MIGVCEVRVSGENCDAVIRRVRHEQQQTWFGRLCASTDEALMLDRLVTN